MQYTRFSTISAKKDSYKRLFSKNKALKALFNQKKDKKYSFFQKGALNTLLLTA
jgi:hemoglobin-like flavoprotein